MAEGNPLWKGLFEWSMRYQDGTRATQPQAMPEAEAKWLDEALKSFMVDLTARMKDIKLALDGNTSTSGEGGDAAAADLESKETLLDELMELVESIDHARDLHQIGGLPTLLDLLGSPHPSLRWRAAEVIGTCVQNNPPVQKWFLDGGVMPRLFPLLDDAHVTVRVKALLALSCMVRGYEPALDEFRSESGVAKLCGLLSQQEPRVQRKCLQLLQYVLSQARQEALTVCGTDVVGTLAATLDTDDNDVRYATLALAKELANSPVGLQKLQEGRAFMRALQALQIRLDCLKEGDWPSVEEETALCMALAREMTRHASLQPSQTAAAQDGPQAMQLAIIPDAK